MLLSPITQARTLAEILQERFADGGDRLALHAPRADGSECLTRSWAELAGDDAGTTRKLGTV